MQVEQRTISVRDVRWVDRPEDKHSPRRSIILAKSEDEGAMYEVASAEGHPDESAAVEVRCERKEAKILGLTKTSYFRLDRVEWVFREQVGALVVVKLCPPGVVIRIRKMQADAAQGVVPTGFY